MASTIWQRLRNMRNNNRVEMFGRPQMEESFAKKDSTPSKVTTLDCTKSLFWGLRMMGIYMPEQNKILYVLYSLIVNGLVTIYQPYAFTVTFLNFSDTNLDMAVYLTALQVAIDVYACATKVVIMSFMIKKIRVADAVMERLDARCQHEDEIEELRKLSRLTPKLVFFFAFAYLTYLGSTSLSAAIFGHPPYSLPLPYIHWRNSWLEFVAAAIIETALMAGLVFQQVWVDSYGVIYVCILRTHMKILLSHVSKLGSDLEMTPEQNMEELKLCVKDHKALMELFNIIEPAISLTIFVQFMVTAIIIGVTMINIFIFAADTTAIVASVNYIYAVSVETFVLCWYAQHLMADSEKLTETIFHSNWIDQGPKYGKMLSFFIKSTQISMEMTAGKLIPITLNSFVNIAKFSFSLYTFIRRMDMKNRAKEA